MKDIYGLFSAFSFLIDYKLHMHLRPNHFILNFLKLLSLSPTWSFLDVHIWGPSVFRLLSPNLLFYDFVQTDSVFYDLHMVIDKIFFS